jgi:transposase-like protein
MPVAKKTTPAAQAAILQQQPGGEPPFITLLRTCAREACEALMAEEMTRLCGVRYGRDNDAPPCFRAGSEAGFMRDGLHKLPVTRPRARRHKADGGGTEEVVLESYAAMRSLANAQPAVVAALRAGASTRSCTAAKDSAVGKSTASRMWVDATAARLEELRTRPLPAKPCFCLMFDGVWLGREQAIIVALGVDEAGNKHILDFECGASESDAICTALIDRLKVRGLRTTTRPLVVLDGSKALKSAVLKAWPACMLQACLVHFERGLYPYLRKATHESLKALMHRLRVAQGELAAREVYAELRKFLAGQNAQALQSFELLGEQLIALHKLGAPSTLNKSLLSTNLIENAIHNHRRGTNRVSRWRHAGDQASRWAAHALLQAEAGFNRIQGHADLPALIAALNEPAPAGVTA